MLKNGDEEVVDKINALLSNCKLMKSTSESEFNENDKQLDDFAMTSSDWDAVLGHATMLTFKKGDVIIGEGTKFTYVLQIAHGCARAEKVIDGKLAVLSRVNAGELIGDMSILEVSLRFNWKINRKDVPAAVSIVADEDTEVYMINKAVFATITTERNIGDRFLKYICGSLAARLR